MDCLALKNELYFVFIKAPKFPKQKRQYVFIPGAFIGSVVEFISLKKLKQITFVLKDSTKIFLDARDWTYLLRKGMKVKVLNNIKIVAVTLNPWSPRGYSFDNQFFLEQMKKALPGIYVIDVRM